MSAVIGAIGLVITIGGAATSYSMLSRKMHHSPLIPDASADEKQRYLAEHGR